MDGNYNYSLSDLATVTGGGFGNGNSFWLIILFLLIFNNGGWNRGGFGYGTGGELNGYATAASQQDILFSSKFQALDNKIDRIGNGIADATFALNNSIKDTAYATTNAVRDSASAIAGTVVSEGRALQTQLAGATLDNQRNVDSVRYDMANFANAINSNIDNKFAALEKNQMQAQIDAQAREINQLYISQQMCGVVRWPNGMTYTANGSPFCNYPGGCGGCCN